MKIVALKEREPGENRVAITPETVKIFTKIGYDVVIEKDAGLKSNFTDNEYIESGAKVSSVPIEIVSDADIILKVQPSPLEDKISEHEFAKKGAKIIGLLNPYNNKKLIEYYSLKKISLLAMELVPRSTKAQSMDVLSSQANLVGYRAVIEAANNFAKAFPMMMTAAGTVTPAKVLVLGAGVAGLQSIATAKRLGAVVYAYDVRAAAKEQVESLGGKFIHPSINDDFSGAGGYAKEVSADFAKLQDQFLTNEISKFDIVITTAQIPGKPAPKLISKEMVALLKAGSIIVDLAAASGGNCELTKEDKIVEHKNVKIIGYSNFASLIAHDASKLYAKNLANLVTYINNNGKDLNSDDEIIKSILLTNNGEILWPKN